MLVKIKYTPFQIVPLKQTPYSFYSKKDYLLDKSSCQTFNVFPVQVGGWFIQCKDSTVQTECFSQCQANDQ